MKRAITSIAAATMVLGSVIPMAFADTTTAYTNAGTKPFVVNGKTLSNPYVLDAQDSGNTTAFLPVYYFDQALSNFGVTAAWNGSTKTWALTSSSLTAAQVTAIAAAIPGGVGTGNTTITLNGTTIKMINTFAAQDPAGGAKGQMTTYFPAYYVDNIFGALGVAATWDGTTGLNISSNATAITSATQTGADTVAVNFNGAVASGTTVTLSQNGVNYTTTATWNAANNVATLNTGYNLAAGTYTVTAGSLTGTVTIATAVPTTISVSTTALATAAGQTVNFSEADQFGNTVQLGSQGSFTVNAVDTTNGKTQTGVVSGDTATLDLSSDVGGLDAAKGDNVVVTVTDTTNGVSKTVTIPVVGTSSLASITLGAASDNGSANVNQGDSGVVLNYTATDVNANKATLPANLAPGSTLDGIQFVSSNPATINASSFSTDANGNLIFNAGAAGTAVITAVDLSTGTSSSTTVTVGNSATVGSFKGSAPSTMITAGTATSIPYTATNGFGSAVTQADFTSGYQTGISIVSSNPAVLPSNFSTSSPESTANNIYFNASTNALEVNPIASGSTTLYFYVGGVLQNSVTLNVQAAAYPAEITANDISKDFEWNGTTGGTYTFGTGDFTILNQYGQAYTPVTGDTVTATASGTGFSAPALASDTLTATGTGSESVTVTYTQPAGPLNGDVAKTVNYTFTVNAVASSNIVSYTLSAPTNIYDGVNGYPGASATPWTSQAVTLVGKDASGNSVQLVNDVPSLLTSSAPSIVAVTGNELAAGVNHTSGAATITAFNATGSQVATATVNAEDAYPIAKTLAVTSNNLTESHTQTSAALSTAVLGNLAVTDQYGVTMPWVGTWIASNSLITVANGATPTFTINGAAAGDSTVLTYVTADGQTASFTVNFN